MSHITTVVFDVGNVLIRWDPLRLYSRLFPDPAKRDWFLATICTEGWNREMDRGKAFAEGIAELVALHPEWETEIRAWDEHWHEMVPGEIPGTVAILERLRARGIPDYAITNFSREKFAVAQRRFPFLQGFRDTIVSAHERLLKPDPAIYRVLIDRNDLDPAACLFVDDSAKNVEGARSVGMAAVVFTTPERLAADLADHGIALD